MYKRSLLTSREQATDGVRSPEPVRRLWEETRKTVSKSWYIKRQSAIRKKLLLVLLLVSLLTGIFMSYVAYENINTMLFVRSAVNTGEVVNFAESVLFFSSFTPISDILRLKEGDEEYERIEEVFLDQVSPTKVDRLTIYRPEADGSQTLLFDVQYKGLREQENLKRDFAAGKNVRIYDENERIIEGGEKSLSDDPLVPNPGYLGYSPGRFDSILLRHDNYIFSEAKFFDENIVIKALVYRSTIEGALWSGVSSLLLSTWGSLLVVTLITVFVAQRIIARPITKLTRLVTDYKHGDGSGGFFENIKTNDEIETLSHSFGGMVGEIESYISKIEDLCEIYYKFVPIQFLDYLGKQEISDIVLGDARTMEFSVLFCDIRGFSQKSESMSAAENFSFVNRVFGVAGPVIRERNGFIDKYIADSVMALFPDVNQAVEAGIALYNALVRDAETCVKFNGEPINVGVGIHTGTTMIGIGESMRLSGTVISDTVNLASRLEGITKYYKTGMIVSKSVIEKLSDKTEARWLGVVKAAGLTRPCEIYEILGCLRTEERQKRLATKDLFEESIRAFHSGNTAAAADGFSEVIRLDSCDTAARIYSEYITSHECTTHVYIAFKNK